ncbi:MAG: hypothetical protein ABMA26_09115 [Limisphaerales bacterium]
MQLVLNYEPKFAHEHDRAERVYLVWPSVAWRIVAPLPSDRRINIFQKAVLGLCRTGSYPVPVIASTLHLHPRLVEAIGMELAGAGWVDPATGRPTPKGLAMLSEEESAMDSLVTGWVFQDPRSGELWPFFSRQLQLQDNAPHSEASRLVLLLGSADKPRKIPAWRMEPQTSPGRPSSEAVLTAIKRFRRREKLKGFMRLAASGLDAPVSGGSPDMLSRIAFISGQPEPVGLVTFAYLPDGGGLPPQICDPFGFGCADEMWRQLKRASQYDEGAAAAQRELLRLAQAADAPALEEHLARQRQSAEAEVVAALSLDIKSFPAVFDHLVDATHVLNLAGAAGAEPQGHLVSVMQFCRQTLEAILKEVSRKFPVNDVHNLLTNDFTMNLATVNHFVASWGFTLPLPMEFQPKPSGGPDKGSVKKASASPEYFYLLPSAVLATILAASRDPMHPLRQSAARDASLFDSLASIIRLGNAGSHDNSHHSIPRRFSMSEANQMRNLTIQVAGCLLGLPYKESEIT